MIRINLLPHREQKRAARKRQFAVIVVIVALLAGAAVLAGHTFINGRISNQEGRNEYLKKETAKLEEQIKDIDGLRSEIDNLKSRKDVVERLQSDRSQVVLLMNYLVRRLPDGTYLKQVKQVGDKVNIQGYTQSNARVSTLMRDLEATRWLVQPELIEIKAVTLKEGNTRVNEFNLDVKIAPQVVDAEGKAEGAAAATKPAPAPATKPVPVPAAAKKPVSQYKSAGEA